MKKFFKPHPRHEDFIRMIWEYVGPYPFVASQISPDNPSQMGTILSFHCKDDLYFKRLNYRTRYKIYVLNSDIAKWCQLTFGPAHPLLKIYSDSYLPAYIRTNNHKPLKSNRRVVIA